VTAVEQTLEGTIERARRSGLDLNPARKLLEGIIARWNPLQIWLFGSRARREETPDSDWDFLVVVPDEVREAELDPKVSWQLRVRGGVPADVIPCRASDFGSARETVNTLSYEATHHGVLAYARS
jgi:predicted nucleotidyltransferase